MRRRTASAASWVRREAGCQGWMCWRKMMDKGEGRGEVGRVGRTVVWRVWKSSVPGGLVGFGWVGGWRVGDGRGKGGRTGGVGADVVEVELEGVRGGGEGRGGGEAGECEAVAGEFGGEGHGGCCGGGNWRWMTVVVVVRGSRRGREKEFLYVWVATVSVN